MKIRALTTGWLLAAAVAAVTATATAEPTLYRYRNAQGVTVIDFSVPARFVHKGYEVLSPTGRVLQKVPPRDDNPMTREALEQLKEQEREDEYILRSYSSLQEIERAKERKLLLVEREIDILESNLGDFENRRVELREKAAGYQASGQKTPANIAQILSDLDRHEQNTRELLQERRRELEKINRRYERYAERLVALRPSVAENDDSGSATAGKDSPQ